MLEKRNRLTWFLLGGSMQRWISSWLTAQYRMPLLLFAGKVLSMSPSYSSSKRPWKRTVKAMLQTTLAPVLPPTYTGSFYYMSNLEVALGNLLKSNACFEFSS